MSEPHFCSFSGSSSDHVSVCLFVRVSIYLSAQEHNGHAWRKKYVVELYFFVAHAQHNASRTIEGEALGANRAVGLELRNQISMDSTSQAILKLLYS